jgi:erythronate-4-phosphate dehydrogenase
LSIVVFKTQGVVIHYSETAVMRIVVDENLSLTDYFFDQFGVVDAYAGRGITPLQLADAEALLVRSVTKVTPRLLQDAAALSTAQQSVGFVGSATIGTDHLDVAGLQAMGVTVANAPGCNAQAVAEYVVTAILTLEPQRAMGAGFTLGIVGLGNVGQRLHRLARRLGWRVIGVDPLVTHAGIEQTTLHEMLPQVDAVSIHVPITHDGPNATFHLFDRTVLAQMQPQCLLINSARGAVVAEQALLDDFAAARSEGRPLRPVVLDVYEHEPRISSRLLDDLALATPHIAGYSLEGKARGTEMVYEAFCAWQGIAPNLSLAGKLPLMPRLMQPHRALLVQLPAILSQLYPIHDDDAAVRACVQEGWVDGDSFDRLRRDYPLRREWASYGDVVEGQTVDQQGGRR